MKKKLIAIICLLTMLLALTATGCNGNVVAFKRGTPVEVYRSILRGFNKDTMPIYGYYGPQDGYEALGYTLPSLITDETFAKMSDAGINVIIENEFDLYEDAETAQEALALAEKYGMKYFMSVHKAFKTRTAAELSYASVDEVVKIMDDVYQYESFAGFYFRDEPTMDMYPGMTEAANVFYAAREKSGYDDLNIFVNLLPSNTTAKQRSNGTDLTNTWEDYIRGGGAIGQDYLMYDFYPLAGTPGNVLSGYFDSMGTVNRIAKETGKPWIGFAQVGGGTDVFLGSRVPTEGELNWDVNVTLAFGSKGIAYYTLVTTAQAGRFGKDTINDDSLLNKFGSKTPFWYYVQKINKQITAIDHVLMNAAHEGVILQMENSPCPYNGADLLSSYRCLKGVSGDASLIGCFDYEGTVALLVVNNSLDNDHAQITLEFDDNYAYEIIQRGISDELTGKEFTLHLATGECALVVVQ